MTALRLAVLGAAVLLGSSAASADEAFRCGQWVVTSEMTLGEITAKCGSPTSRTSRTEDTHYRNRNTGLMVHGQTTIETLTWDRGARAAPMVVTVVDGRIKSIERKP